MGGAMDLVSNKEQTRVVVLIEHIDEKGNVKILKDCTFPLTGTRCVSRLITDLADFDVDREKRLTLIEIHQDTTLSILKSKTGCEFEIAADLKTIDV